MKVAACLILCFVVVVFGKKKNGSGNGSKDLDSGEAAWNQLPSDVQTALEKCHDEATNLEDGGSCALDVLYDAATKYKSDKKILAAIDKLAVEIGEYMEEGNIWERLPDDLQIALEECHAMYYDDNADIYETGKCYFDVLYAAHAEAEGDSEARALINEAIADVEAHIAYWEEEE